MIVDVKKRWFYLCEAGIAIRTPRRITGNSKGVGWFQKPKFLKVCMKFKCKFTVCLWEVGIPLLKVTNDILSSPLWRTKNGLQLEGSPKIFV